MFDGTVANYGCRQKWRFKSHLAFWAVRFLNPTGPPTTQTSKRDLNATMQTTCPSSLRTVFYTPRNMCRNNKKKPLGRVAALPPLPITVTTRTGLGTCLIPSLAVFYFHAITCELQFRAEAIFDLNKEKKRLLYEENFRLKGREMLRKVCAER